MNTTKLRALLQAAAHWTGGQTELDAIKPFLPALLDRLEKLEIRLTKLERLESELETLRGKE